MAYSDLSDNQKAGIDYNAAHNGKTVDGYIQWRLEQDGDRGYKELITSQLAGVTAKLAAEPTVIADVEAVVDAQIEVVQVAREQAAIEAAAAVEEEVGL